MYGRNQLVLQLPLLVLSALGLRHPAQFTTSEARSLVLRLSLPFTEHGAVLPSFHKNELSYEFRCGSDVPFSHVDICLSTDIALNWWQRHVAPVLAWPLHGRCRRYDIRVSQGGQMTGWQFDYIAGSARCVARHLDAHEGQGPRMLFRPVPMPSPFSLVRRFFQRLLSGLLGSPT